MMLSIFKSFFKSFRRKSSQQDLREGRRGDRHRSFFKNLLSRLFVIGDRMAAGVKGFTLIELLVSILISTIIISTLLAFTVNIMETDRREQAKVETQGDVQSALNFIADDLQEAVYIYNADSLNYNSGAASPGPGIKNQLPDTTVDAVFASTKSTPVLVFWKRKYFAPDADVTVNGSECRRGAAAPLQNPMTLIAR
jgi:prepilin-type N-terminal cleavage/methylation domain-containing protein